MGAIPLVIGVVCVIGACVGGIYHYLRKNRNKYERSSTEVPYTN